MNVHPVIIDECFWQWDGNAWVQVGDCDDNSCTCDGKPSTNGDYEGHTIPGICSCSSHAASRHSVWSGSYRQLRDDGGSVDLVVSNQGETIPTELIETKLTFAKNICYIAEHDQVSDQSIVFAVIQKGTNPVHDGVTVDVRLSDGRVFKVSQDDKDSLKKVVSTARRLFEERDVPTVRGERVFFRLKKEN